MSPPRIVLRPPANRGFLQGYPGIPPSETRPPAHLSGTIEVQANAKPIEAAWLRVEMAKTETLPSGESWTELIGQGPMDVWAAEGGVHVDGEAWAQLPGRSFPFRVPIPEKLPATLRLEKNGGIRYELIATLCVRVKKGFLRRTQVKRTVSDAQTIVLEKHELHSTWPLYNVPEEFEETSGLYRVRLYRNKQSYAALDSVDVRVIVYSKAPDPTKLKSISVGVRQTVTYLPQAKGDVASNAAPGTVQQRSEILAQKSKNIRKKINQDEFLMYDLSVTLPKSRTLMTVSTAKHIEIAHSLRVAVEIGKECIVFERLKMQISAFPSSVSAATTARIGHVPDLCLDDGARPDADEDVGDAYASPTQPTYDDTSPTRQRPRYDEYERMLMDDAGSIPRLQSDASALGTPTPRGPLVFQAEQNHSPVMSSQSPGPYTLTGRPASVMAQTTLMQLPSNSVRPGDLLPFDGGVTHAPSATLNRPSSVAMFPTTPRSDRSMRQRAASPTYAEPIRIARSPPSSAAAAPAPLSSADARGSGNLHPTAPPYRGFESAESEKVRLFERARAEAERYQNEYEHGATFPTADAAGPAGSAAGDLSYTDRAASSSAAAPSAAPSAAPRATAGASFPTAAEEKAALYERARSEVDAYHNTSAGLAGTTPTEVPDAHIPAPPPSTLRPTSYAGGADSRAAAHADASALAAPTTSFGSQGTTNTTLQLPLVVTPTTEAPDPHTASPYLTKSEARAMEEKARLQHHYTQQDDAAAASTLAAPAPAPAPTSQAPSRSTTPPPRPPKLPLS
ncbi:hypothetical protein MBRA1_003145 [Malassezia brasiliensis]|uniref:Arrestin C-terminal-like domain-containing protein n=1 Tax=Malassezia brasiliensis TaxID=1821822 RepID=A0AAF0DW67_9BASI|nr:hypothetical protein MBRA1_003145 [Malassezia brasiliensis]